MQSELTNGAVLAKTRELCQTIVDQESFQGLRRSIDAFMANEEAQGLYQTVAHRGEALHQKQQLGQPLDPEEIAQYENDRQLLLGNEVARAFLDAQEQMHEIQQTVSRYVMKTLEVGRVPEPEDFGGCGQGCSCG
jgi:cell fate (sporulation/competence/biofilm development) regulator YlbF (YheA/YmcA/DUF963 family)